MRRWCLAVFLMVGLSACGTNVVTTAVSGTTVKGISLFCADLMASSPVTDPGRTMSTSPAAMFQGLTDLLRYWEQVKRDAPPEIQPTMSTMMDALRRGTKLDPRMSQSEAITAWASILNSPASAGAAHYWITYVTKVCSGVDAFGSPSTGVLRVR